MFPYVNNLPLLHALLSLSVAAMVAFLLYFFIPTLNYSYTKLDGLLRSPLMEDNNDVHQLEKHEKDGVTNYETNEKIQKKKQKQRKADDHLPPGSLGLPWIGETLQFALFNSCPIGTPSPFLSARLQRYGQVFKTHLMGRPTVVSMDPGLNKYLLLNEETLVRVYFPAFITKIAGPNLTLHGARHKRMREIATSPLGVGPASTQHHWVAIQEQVLSMFGSWGQGKFEMDAHHEAEKFSFSLIMKHIMGVDATHDPTFKKVMHDFSLLKEGYSAIPLDFPGTTYHRVLKARDRIIDRFREILQERRRYVGPPRNADFMDTVMETTDECGRALNDQDILELLFFLIFGAFETTSIFLTNLLKFLSENPHVVDELRREHLGILEGKKAGELLAWDDYKRMHFTNSVNKEALRLASIAHYLTRETLQDIQFQDMVIPKGWMVLLSFSMVHLNPKYYPNPLKFDPWRWKDVANNSPQLLMPFGGGIRTCIGYALAKCEASVFLHYFVTRYRWERIGKKDGELDVVSGLTLPTLKNGLRLRVEATS